MLRSDTERLELLLFTAELCRKVGLPLLAPTTEAER